MAIEKALTDNNIPSTDTAVLKVKQVFPSEEERLVLDNIYRVGDLYVEINLVTFNPVTKIIGVDIGDNLNPPAGDLYRGRLLAPRRRFTTVATTRPNGPSLVLLWTPAF